MTVAKRRHSSSTDDKVEAKRKIIRKSIDEIAAEVEAEFRKASLQSRIDIVVPSRCTLVTIAAPHDVPPHEWSHMSAIVRQVLSQKLGTKELRGRPLTSGRTNAMADVTSPPPSVALRPFVVQQG
jgi:hypothetical protein